MPDFQPPTATGRMLPNRAKLKMITARRDPESGRVDMSLPQEAQPTCVLCGIVGGDPHSVRGQTMYAHSHCIQALQRKLNQPQKAVHKAMSTPPDHKQATDTDSQTRGAVVWALTEFSALREAVTQRLKQRMGE